MLLGVGPVGFCLRRSLDQRLSRVFSAIEPSREPIRERHDNRLYETPKNNATGQFVRVYILSGCYEGMPYEYSDLVVLKRIVRRECPRRTRFVAVKGGPWEARSVRWAHPRSTRWYPVNFVVAHTDGNQIVDIDEENTEETVGGISPSALKFADIKEDDIVYEALSRHPRQAYAARILLSQFDKADLDCPPGCVPTVVAVEDRPMLAMYLLACEQMGWQETADALDITRPTVSKYMRRLERRLER